MKKIDITLVCLALSSSGLIILQMYSDETKENTVPYQVACLPRGTDMAGVDTVLRPYYQIAHTPSEGGRCYFRFPTREIKCMSPQQAAAERTLNGSNTYNLSYGSHSGKACYFKNTLLYQNLISRLKSKPPISRQEYSDSKDLVNNGRDAIAHLSQKIDGYEKVDDEKEKVTKEDIFPTPLFEKPWSPE